MATIRIGDQEFEAATGPNGVLVWPPTLLESTVRGFERRLRAEMEMDEKLLRCTRRGGARTAKKRSLAARWKRVRERRVEIRQAKGRYDV